MCVCVCVCVCKRECKRERRTASTQKDKKQIHKQNIKNQIQQQSMFSLPLTLSRCFHALGIHWHFNWWSITGACALISGCGEKGVACGSWWSPIIPSDDHRLLSIGCLPGTTSAVFLQPADDFIRLRPSLANTLVHWTTNRHTKMYSFYTQSQEPKCAVINGRRKEMFHRPRDFKSAHLLHLFFFHRSMVLSIPRCRQIFPSR